MASSSGSVLAGRKRKSVSRDPDQLSNGGAAAVPPFVVDLTGDSPAKPSSSGRRLTDDESEDDILVMGDRIPPTRQPAPFARSRSSSLEIEIVDSPYRKKPRLSPPMSSPESTKAPAAAPADVDGLFFFDDAPKAVKKKAAWLGEDSSAPPTPSAEGVADVTSDTLVLPSHIIIEGEPLAAGETATLAAEGGPRPLTEAEVYADDLGKIEFLDGGEDKPVQRYFDLTEDGKPAPVGKQHIVCSVCKERGHVARDCKVVICLTCGARDEHETRNCPVALICFACGGRGHRSKDCPAPRHMRQYRHSGPMCDRCGSDVHPGNNCPTLWRIYSYLTPQDRTETLATRARLYEEGGFEGDVLVHNPDDEEDGWCYNCAGYDHYGDDCPEPRISRAPRPDFSAFSAYNSQNSPFWTGPSTSQRPPRPKRNRPSYQPPRDLVVPDEMANVGWRGRQREKLKALEYEKARKAAEGDDAGSSWFDRPTTSSRGELSIKGKGKGSSARKTDEGSRKTKRQQRKERRASGDRPARDDDERPFVSGGSGTQLEAEYALDYGGGSSKSGNRSRSNSARNRESSNGDSRGKDAPKSYSFKFAGGPLGGGGTASGSDMRAHMGGDSRQSGPSSSAGGSSSLLTRLDSDTGRKGTNPASSALAPLSRAQLRDAQRKEKERHEEVNSLLARLGGKKGGRPDWLDSPDRRGGGPGGKGTGGSGTGTPTGSRSRYQGGYR